MELELAGPRVKDERGADRRGQTRAREVGERARRHAKEHVENAPTSEGRKRPKLGGKREDDVEVRGIEHACPLRLDPFLLGQRLTLRAMPIAARVVRGMLVLAGRTLVDVP